MKAAAIVMVCLLVASLAGVGYLVTTAGVDACVVSVSSQSCENQTETFLLYRDDCENGSVVGTVFTDATMGDAQEYNFVTYTVNVSNHSFLNVESIAISIKPKEGDVLQIGDYSQRQLANGESGDFDAIIISKKGIDYSRTVTVTYYIFGIPLTKEVEAVVTYG